MFDLSKHIYNEVLEFLEENITYKYMEPLTPYTYDSNISSDIYEIIVVSMPIEYFDDPEKNVDVPFEKCYYFLRKYNDETFHNELSVFDCGGYYVAIAIFKNKINISSQYVLRSMVGNKSEIVP